MAGERKLEYAYSAALELKDGAFPDDQRLDHLDGEGPVIIKVDGDQVTLENISLERITMPMARVQELFEVIQMLEPEEMEGYNQEE